MKSKPRYLTKSRFKLALDCPTKLYYTRNPLYEDTSETDSFLQGLAQGGFQVEELVRLYFPEGVAILGDDWDYDKLAQRTSELLEEENVTIFEAAFLFDGLFIRVDILEKKGNNIRLIEVKAKSIDGESHSSFLTKSGVNTKMQGYLYDVAFQQYVIQKCYPNWKIKAFLNLVDKSKHTTVNGLNSHFKIVPNADLRTGVMVTPNLKREDLGASILAMISVEEEVQLILSENPQDPERTFADTVEFYKHHYANNMKIDTSIGLHCQGCEFKNDSPEPNKKSGFHDCWMTQLPNVRPDLVPLSRTRLNDPKTYDVWYKPAKDAVVEHRYFMDELTREDVKDDPGANGFSRSDRQWIQIEKTITQDNTIEVDVANLRLEMSQWKYPLNFIDFETCAVAIPFTSGMRPYEQLAFQFSHHIVYEDGRVVHHSEYINLEIGVFPNFDFLRALKKSLAQNKGSIFRYHNHENTIVNVIYNQLLSSKEPDREELFRFVESISHPTGSSLRTFPPGERDMIDLQRTVLRNYYHPQTGGSNSIKAILPAVLESSSLLKSKYTKTIKDINLSSLNFDDEYRFLTLEDGVPINPYSLLPPLFDGISNEQLEDAVASASAEIRQIADGGAALFAYAKMQDETIGDLERKETKNALLRYCELDTLAMVMIYEHFKELCEL
ncbi:Hypothetical protein I595_2780 [Croceitalea dokdonensis DOKDO 023]|uniref:DUF2779 domain-containing protein n=1 Tax=Croceitalea dokdonensis DOKDO 023 TaxID=1300341 RepID=A0A0P7AUK9_9FLAO|nr:DUF2779 domain-containing protein [Croceitalea dokdonensis]KPM31513.1 Hypothetical protein I595_2780 [Croceitalea dokdonensis DOKDO 023]